MLGHELISGFDLIGANHLIVLHDKYPNINNTNFFIPWKKVNS